MREHYATLSGCVALIYNLRRNADLIYKSQVTPSTSRRPRKLYREDIYGIAAASIGAGGIQSSATHHKWDISGNCERGFHKMLYSHKEVLPSGSANPPMSIELVTRCRKCSKCLQARGNLWRARALIETKKAARTWLATLTLSPESHFKIQCEIRGIEGSQGVDYDALPEPERFALQHAAIGKQITRWVKRVRKNSGAPFKYLLVAEAHKSGLPHYHGLFHESAPERPLRYEVLKHSWPLGFAQYKLVKDPRGASYVSKYLAKSALARVRASVGYGLSE